MPAATITTSAAPAFSVPPNAWGFRMRNVSDTTIYWRDSATPATSGATMGMPLDPGQEHVECFAENTRNARSIQMIHGGSGNKTLVYDILQVQVQAIAGGLGKVFITDINEGDYETIAASQTDQSLGATGAAGDYLSGLLIVPGTTAAGAVSIKDGAGSAISVFAGGGTTALSTLIPFFVPLGIKSTTGAWKVTTGSNVTAIGVGNFT